MISGFNSMRNAAARMLRTLVLRGEWNIGVVFQPIHSFLSPGSPQRTPEVHWLPPLEDGKFLADPFGIERDGRIYILCEEFDYGPHKGVISVVEIADGILASEAKTAMDRPFHMSYPYLLEYQGEVYCIPETFQAGEIGIYRALEFPYRWAKAATLIADIAALDSTVFQYDGRWWLACTDQDKGPHDKLFVWHASNLFGPWEPHASNPVKTDIHSARPAGTPFVHEGSLYRPAQDCSGTYGGRIVLNRVVELTPAEFEEEPAATVEAFANSPYPDGLHTISAVGDITLIDGKRDRFIGRALKSALVRRMRASVSCGEG